MYFPDLGVVTPSVGAAHEFTMYKSQREEEYPKAVTKAVLRIATIYNDLCGPDGQTPERRG